MLKIISLMGFLSIHQFNEDDFIRYIWEVIEYFIEALADIVTALWDAFWNFILSWLNMDNAFWVTLILIMIVSVYIVLKKAKMI